MENKALEWWNNLTYSRKVKLAETEQWTTVEDISNYQIKLIYLEKNYGY